MIVLAVIALLISGYFIYKYAYIYTERRKYDQAEVEINKVADDLQTKGIVTKGVKDCAKDIGKFDSGSLFCSVGITYIGNEQNRSIKEVIGYYESIVIKNSFNLNPRYNYSYEIAPEPSGATVYTLNSNPLQCQLRLGNTWDENSNYTVDFFCGDSSKFSIY